jgi:DNA-binding transcriptional regulator YiaG
MDHFLAMKAKAHRTAAGRVSSGARASRKVPTPARVKAQIASLLAREVRSGLSQVAPQKVARLYRDISTIRRQVRELVIEAARRVDEPASEVETLEGEGLRRVETDEERRALEHALAEARQRGQATIATILARPEMLTGEAFAARANTTRETVNKWRSAKRILGLEGNTRGIRYPAWQLDEHGALLKDLPAFLEAVPGPWVAYRMLTSEWPELGGKTGVELLKRGKVAELVEATRHFGETF